MNSKESDTSVQAVKKSSVWETVLGDAVTLTSLITAIFYLWGKIYFDTLASKLGFSQAMFEIPIYDVLFRSWDKALLVMMGLVVIVSLKSMSGLFQFLLFLLIALPIRITWLILKRLAPTAVKVGLSQIIDRVMSPVLVAGRRHIPKFILDDATKTDDSAILGVAKSALLIGVILFGALTAESEANNVAKSYETGGTPLRPITVFCEDGQRYDGTLVGTIGDAIIIDEDGSLNQRMLVRKGAVKRIVRHMGDPKGAVKNNASTTAVTK